MNYRHAFHSGNFADVLKHAVFSLVIEYLKQKPAPFRVIDTHAGAGRYDLSGEAASKTGEWLHGIGRLMGPGAEPLPDPVAELLKPYLDAIKSVNATGGLVTYPGSPLLALALMRPQDRLIANELHPEDSLALRDALHHDGRAKVLSLDGWQSLKSLLPPKERRGVVLIDPPFEEPGEFDRLVEGLAEATRRFATGVYLVWYPVKDTRAVARFHGALQKSGHVKRMLVEFSVRSVPADGKLAGTGLAILNPPFPLEQQLQILLPFFVSRLAQGDGASASIDGAILRKA